MARGSSKWHVDGTAALSVGRSTSNRPDAVIVPFPCGMPPSTNLDVFSDSSAFKRTQACSSGARKQQAFMSSDNLRATRRFDSPTVRESKKIDHVLASSTKLGASTMCGTDDGRARNGQTAASRLITQARHGLSHALDASEMACSLRFEGAKGCAYGRFTRIQTVAAFGGFSLFGIAVILLTL